MRGKNYPLYEANRFKTLPQCLAYIKKEYGSRKALTFYEDDGTEKSYTFLEFSKDIEACMDTICRYRMQGKHIAIVGENSYEWAVAFWAVTCTGGTAVAVDVEQTADEIMKAVRYADSEALILSETYEGILGKRRPVGRCLVMGKKQTDDSFGRFIEEGRKQEYAYEVHTAFENVEPEDEALIVYTSGTTSTAKPVILTHGNLMYNAWGALAMVDAGKRVFTPLPFYHTYALTCGMLGCLAQGIHFSANGSLKTMMRDICFFEPETLISVPMITDTLLKTVKMEQRKAQQRENITYEIEKAKKLRKWHIRTKSYRNRSVDMVLGKNLKLIISGGAHLNEKNAEELGYYGIQVIQGYGITECGPLISSNRNRMNKLKSVGLVLPETELKFIGGEILVKGPSVFKGYYKSEVLTREALVNGWFHTGDIGYMDKKGFLYICGRKKNLIVFSNGKKVVPEELELYLTSLPLVKEGMVYGANSGQTADEVTLSAMIYPDQEKTKGMTSFEILEKIQEDVNELNKRLPLYKRVQSIKLTETEFGKTGIRKIKRNGVSL